MPETETKDAQLAYIPTPEDMHAQRTVLGDFTTANSVLQKSYAQFNNRSVLDAVDDWTQRWNGYIPPRPDLIDEDQSRIFLNFTRNQIISYLAKTSQARPKAKIKAVNNKTGMTDQKFADVLSDLNQYSLDEDNGDARFLEAALEAVTKGTVIVYEGYLKRTQKVDVPVDYDTQTGKIKTKQEERVVFDNCYQKIVPLEDFLIANPYEPDIQKQPFVLWREITTYFEGWSQFGKYKDWKYVRPGEYVVSSEPTTFYRNKIATDLAKDQVEILRYYNKKRNKFCIVVNGIVLYNDAIPFKDGMYPFAKGIFEPFGNGFFWGMGFAQKIMGEQDTQNDFINAMIDKTHSSLLPYGLSADLDDLIEDDILQPNKIRKVGDINKWKFDTLPGVSAGEQNMLQMVLSMGRENSGDMTGAGAASTPRGGKLTMKQVQMKQQEAAQRLSFSMGYMEDMERDRTLLRVHHILQFYSIPKIEKITGKGGKEVEQMTFRDVKLSDMELSSGKKGHKVIKIVGGVKNPDEKAKLQDHLSVIEAMGEHAGTPTEAIAISVDTFYDFNLSIVVVKQSSFQQTQVLDQAMRHEYANWRIELQKMGFPVNMQELVKWVDESYNIDTEKFEAKQVPQGQQPGQPNPTGQPSQPGQPPNGGDQPQQTKSNLPQGAGASLLGAGQSPKAPIESMA